MTNPLIDDIDNRYPPFDKIQVKDIEPAVNALIDQNLSQIDALVKTDAPPTWGTLVEPIELADDALNKAWSCVSHLNSVVNSKPLREVYNRCVTKLTDYGNKVGQNQPLYQAYVALKESAEFNQLNKAQQKVIDNALQDFQLAGVALEEPARSQFADLNKQLSQYQSQFQDNIMDATDHWHLDITDETRLLGIPADTLSTAKQNAEKAKVSGWRLTLDFPCYIAVMTYAEDRALRQTLHEAFSTRASEVGPNAGKWDNSELMQKIIDTRHQMAKLIGFDNYAKRSLAKKMAKTPEEVMAFLQNLAEKAKPFAEQEFQALKDFAKQTDDITLEPWDVTYYSEKRKNQLFSISQEQLRPYFPIDRVLAGMFTVVKKLYGIDIKEQSGVPSWHADVRYFNLIKNNEPFGGFYLDLYARPQKRGGAWMDEARVRFKRPTGTLQQPIAFLTCNFQPASGDKPALLTHDEVITLFHEFGHGLHHLLTQIDYPPVAGINGVAWDAVECPSQFMENFCWEKQALDFISGHFQDEKPLPAEWLDNLLKAKNFQSGMALIRQLEFALFDFRLHLEYDPKQGAKVMETLNAVRQQVSVLPQAPYARFPHSFSHIFAGGYAAGYYSYLWAEVLAQDAFDKFEQEGIFNPQTGQQFLEKLLSQGGAQEAAILFKNFRGREPSLDPLLRHRGLSD